MPKTINMTATVPNSIFSPLIPDPLNLRIIRCGSPNPYVAPLRQGPVSGKSGKIACQGSQPWPATRVDNRSGHAGPYRLSIRSIVSEAPVPEIRVAPDHFDVVTTDMVLAAELNSTFALCLYDAVLESGALIHLRMGPPGRIQDPELTDTTLSTDLLLLDRFFTSSEKLRPVRSTGRPKCGQVQDSPGARERFDGVRGFLSAFSGRSNVKLSRAIPTWTMCSAAFRPAMGHPQRAPCRSRMGS